ARPRPDRRRRLGGLLDGVPGRLRGAEERPGRRAPPLPGPPRRAPGAPPHHAAEGRLPPAHHHGLLRRRPAPRARRDSLGQGVAGARGAARPLGGQGHAPLPPRAASLTNDQLTVRPELAYVEAFAGRTSVRLPHGANECATPHGGGTWTEPSWIAAP